MARVKQRIYEGSKERSMDGMVQVCQITLNELGMEVTTHFLDKSLIECIGKPPAGSPLGKENRVTVYKEGDKIYIKLTYEMKNPDQFWTSFETNLQIHGASTKEIEIKAKVVTHICKTIRQMGGTIDEEEAWDFLYNFEKTLKKLPDGDEEFNQIAMDYIRIMDEKNILTEDDNLFVEEAQPAQTQYSEEQYVEEIEEIDQDIYTSETEVLMEMIKEIETIDPVTKEFYLSLFSQLDITNQERLVEKIKAVEEDLNKIPYLLDVERKKIREDVYKLAKKKRRQKLTNIIKDRKKNEAVFMTRYMNEQIRGNLIEVPFLTSRDVDEIMNVILTIPFNEKKKIVKKVNDIEGEIIDLIQKGLSISDMEKRNWRLDLIRLDRNDRLKQYDGIIETHNKKRVSKILFQEIPQLEFESNEKLIKELMWLQGGELTQRIEQIKNEIGKKSQEKSDIFEKSAAGSACTKCGWPLGKFTKKCPRCGFNPDDDWFNL